MPDIESVTRRVDALIATGEALAASEPSAHAFQEWRVQSISALLSILGNEHTYPAEFKRFVAASSRVRIQQGIGVLRALKNDLENGYLSRIETLISASVFDDFLEMTNHLLENNYKDPAASLCGAVLENSLRKICTNHDITLKERDDLSALNQKCADKKVYTRLVQRQIAVWTDIRNNADHGKFEQYSLDDVSRMVEDVRSFLASYLV